MACELSTVYLHEFCVMAIYHDVSLLFLRLHDAYLLD